MYQDSPINTLVLTNCDDQDLGALPDILSSVKELQRFTFGIYWPWETTHGRAPGIDPDGLRASLEPHACTLVELVLFGDDAVEFLESSTFGTLKHYKNLKRLAIPEYLHASGNAPTLHFT